MKALEFSTQIANNAIEIPDNIKVELKDKIKKVRVILLIEDEPEDEKSWKKVTTKQFLEGYSEDDSIYDNY